MIPVTQEQVREALEADIDDPEFLPSRSLKASELVEGYLGIVFDPDNLDDPIPDAVTSVTASVVARLYALDNSSTPVPQFTDSSTQTMGPLTATLRYNSDAVARDPWLTKGDKLRLRNVYSGMRELTNRRWDS